MDLGADIEAQAQINSEEDQQDTNECLESRLVIVKIKKNIGKSIENKSLDRSTTTMLLHAKKLFLKERNRLEFHRVL